MTIHPDVVRDLELLARSLVHPDDPSAQVDLVAAVTAMQESAADAVPSYLGLQLILHPPPAPDGTRPPPLGISTLPDDEMTSRPSVGSTLLVPLPAPGTRGRSTPRGSDPPPWRVDIVLHAANPGAFVDLAADLAWLVGTPLGDVEVDRHLSPGRRDDRDDRDDRDVDDGQGQQDGLQRRVGSVAAASMLDQALGVLLARGFTPEEAVAELERRSTRAGSALAAAEELLAGLDQRPPSEVDPNGRPREV